MRSIPLLLYYLVLLLLCSCKEKVHQPQVWPEITQEVKPWSRWWWHGSSVTKAGITAELEAYQKAGIGGLELTPIYGVIGEEDQFVDYLSPEWMVLFQHTLSEAKRLGLGMDIATGTGWPFGGPHVTQELACKRLAHSVYQLKEGEELKERVQYIESPLVRAVPNQVYQLYGIYKEAGEQVSGSRANPTLIKNKRAVQIEDLVEPIATNTNLQALALDQVRFEKPLPLQVLMAYSSTGETIDLTAKVDEDGQLNWTAGQGDWTLYAVFQGWHGKMVERAAPGGEGNVIDHFSETAIKQYLTKFDTAFAGMELDGLRAFFNDSYEVDDASGQADWTPKLFEEFKDRRGYDLKLHLPALLTKDSSEKNRRVLQDYRETVADLLLATFTKEWKQWADAKSKIIRNQAHGSPANILDLYAASDIPETEGTDIIRIKFASSAAHIANKKLVSAEAATWLDEHFTSDLAALKENLDRYFIGGVNHIFYHGTCYSPPDDPWPGRLFYAAIHANPRNSLWPHFSALNEYVARTQAFLQQGQVDNDILLYFPIYDRFASEGEILEHFEGGGKADSHFRTLAEQLQQQGYSFDIISDRQIQNLNLKENELHSGHASYKTILLPKCQYIPLSTMLALANLAKAGAKILFFDSWPESVSGFGDFEVRQDSFQNLLAHLDLDKSNTAILGNGAFYIGDNLLTLLEQADVHREKMVDIGLDFIRYKDEEGSYYLISNWSDKKFDNWIPLNHKAVEVLLFDPMNGQIGKGQSRQSDSGDFEVRLQMPVGSTIILKMMNEAVNEKAWLYHEISEPDQILTNWNVEFTQGGPTLPAAKENIELSSWAEWDEACQSFSGTARYSTTFNYAHQSGNGVLLDLGEVAESARVWLNKQEIGTLIGPVFQLFIDEKMLKDENLLEVEVCNLMANRIAYMDKEAMPWKKFYNINFPARRAENRGEDGVVYRKRTGNLHHPA